MTLQYMLDTNICILLMTGRSEAVTRHVALRHPGELCMSVVTEAELEFGVEHSDRRAANHEVLVALRARVPPLPFDGAAATAYGKLRARLTRAGQVIGPLDLLIAAHAVSARLTLVSDNTREFRRMKELSLENWAR